ncbi:major facilitator superfamily domain-containing protein 6-like [Tachypleus tridentatus]|uniref:major facilitator superfamily domain-containing protein 6-like n=1 Tax=Tachypleus tridentatus TaxID=6853 RepID=UPI003FD580CB
MKTFWEDLTRKELVPVKILMFLIYGGQATLYPYFTVHLKSLGMSIRETAIIFAVQPLVAFFVAPVIGALADRIGNFKVLFCFFLTFSAGTCLALYFTPPVENTFQDIELKLTCHTNASFQNIVSMNVNDTCKLGNHTYMEQLTVLLSDCRFICEGDDKNISDSLFCFKFNSINQSCTNATEKINFEIFDLNSTAITENNENETTVIHYTIAKKFLFREEMYDEIVCQPKSTTNGVSNCMTLCNIQTKENNQLCLTERKPIKTFWIYLSIRLGVSLGIGLVNGLFDAASMAVAQRCQADIGYQRMWQAIAMCTFAPVSGGLVDWISVDINAKNYSPCFYLYAALYVTAAIVSLFVDLSMKIPSESAFKNLGIILRNVEVDLMLFHLLFLGISWGYLENFLFWFLESELKSTTLLMGLTFTVGAGTGVLMAIYSTWITQKIGYVNVIVLAFAAYVIRFIGYSYATTPYLCLIYETMESFTVTLMTVGVTLYCSHLAPLEMLTTMMTLWNNVHFISGRAFGSLSGGFMTDAFGFRQTFRLYSYIAAGLCVFYFLINVFYLRKRPLSEKAADSSPETKKELEHRERAISLSLVVSNHGFHEISTSSSLRMASLYSSNMQSILALEGRRHSSIPMKSRCLKEVETREKASTSLSFVPSTDKTLDVSKTQQFLKPPDMFKNDHQYKPSRSRANSKLTDLPENSKGIGDQDNPIKVSESHSENKSVPRAPNQNNNSASNVSSKGHINTSFEPETNHLQTTGF